MNIELIKKYKTEFDHFLNGGKIIGKQSLKDKKWESLRIEVFECKEDWEVIIIDDEYSYLRKALCDDKIIQIWEVIEQHVSDSSRDIYGWKDFKSFKPDSPFGGNVHNYRIKPEEPEFKVGDFVRNESIGLVKQYSLSNLEYDKTATNINNWIKWKPSHKELCYFTHDTNTKTSAILREFREISKDGFYVDSFGARFIYCEPFLNSKPSWFND